MGVTWGLSFSLAKLATNLGGAPLGISFWTALFSGIILFTYCLVTKQKFVLTWDLIKIFLILALLGTALPGLGFYYAASKVPAGVLSITVTLVPIFTYGLALTFGLETFSNLRFLGILLGFASICLIVVPDTSLPTKDAAFWVLIACLSSFFYATENIYLAVTKLENFGPIRLSCGMHLMASVILFFPSYFSGSLSKTIINSTELTVTLFCLSLITATAYTLFIFTVRKSGAIFASQVGYLVTISGLVWGIALFSETHSPWIWIAFSLMICGLSFVSPRTNKQIDS